MKTILAFLFLLSFACEAQKLIYNTDINRGNVNQWIDTTSRTNDVVNVKVDSVNTPDVPINYRYYIKFILAYVAPNGFIVGNQIPYGQWMVATKKDYEHYKKIKGQNVANPQTGDIVYVEVKRQIIK